MASPAESLHYEVIWHKQLVDHPNYDEVHYYQVNDKQQLFDLSVLQPYKSKILVRKKDEEYLEKKIVGEVTEIFVNKK